MIDSQDNIIQPIARQPLRIVSYLATGRLLHLSMILFVLEAYWYWVMLQNALSYQSKFWTAFWVVFFLFSFLHIFLVQADSWSRFQDYKRVKDQLFLYGFKKKIIRQYAGSRCQRNAVQTAAEELGYLDETNAYLYELGYRWHHFVPDFMVRDPLFIFKEYYWKRTFNRKYYKSKINFCQLSQESYLQ